MDRARLFVLTTLTLRVRIKSGVNILFKLNLCLINYVSPNKFPPLKKILLRLFGFYNFDD